MVDLDTEIVSFDDRRSLSLSTAVEAEISYASVGGGGRGDGREEATTASALHLLPFTGAAQQHYVSQLLSFTLDRLHKEPELLRVDAERIRRQMQEVAVGNYRAFIAAADTVSFIKEQLSGFDKHLDSLITGIPNLTAGCTEFIESAQKILEESKLNQILLDNHSTLLDLLEIPQLMDTCIRNGNYDEALDLEAFVNKLSKMHTELPIIQALASEVRKTPQSLLSQLLQKLRSNIQYCAMGLGLVGLDFRGLLPSLFESAVINLFSKNMSIAVENFQIVLDLHRWVPLPSVGFVTNGTTEESKDDVAPPSVLMEHPPIAVFVNGVSAAMNELRPCAPVSLKNILAQEVVKGLQVVSDSLVRYNALRVLRGNESTLFLSLCRAFIEVAHPFCATCFGRCYPNGANLIREQRNLFDGVCQLFAIPPSKGLKDSLESQEEKHQADASGAQNGAPSNSDEEPGIYGRTDPSGSVVVPTNAASGN